MRCWILYIHTAQYIQHSVILPFAAVILALWQCFFLQRRHVLSNTPSRHQSALNWLRQKSVTTKGRKSQLMTLCVRFCDVRYLLSLFRQPLIPETYTSGRETWIHFYFQKDSLPYLTIPTTGIFPPLIHIFLSISNTYLSFHLWYISFFPSLILIFLSISDTYISFHL
jgi:hypothetical protein